MFGSTYPFFKNLPEARSRSETKLIELSKEARGGGGDRRMIGSGEDAPDEIRK